MSEKGKQSPIFGSLSALAGSIPAGQSAVKKYAAFPGWLARSDSPGKVRILLSPTFDEYIDVAQSEVKGSAPFGPQEIGASLFWIPATTVVRHVWFDLFGDGGAGAGEKAVPAKGGGGKRDGKKDGGAKEGEGPAEGEKPVPTKNEKDEPAEEVKPRRRRPSWQDWIRRWFPVDPGEHRRHIISYRYVREFAKHLTAEMLKLLGYDPEKLGGVEAARKKYVDDIFNNPDNFWRGDGWENSWLGWMMRWIEEYNWDFPTPEQAERERLRREQEANEREGRDRDGRDSEGRDRDGRDREGRDRDGRDREGRDRDGRDREGRDRDGRDHDGRDRDGRDRDGYDRNGQDRQGATREAREGREGGR